MQQLDSLLWVIERNHPLTCPLQQHQALHLHVCFFSFLSYLPSINSVCVFVSLSVCSTDVFICTSPIMHYKHCPYEKVSLLPINAFHALNHHLVFSCGASRVHVCFSPVCLGGEASGPWLSGAGHPDQGQDGDHRGPPHRRQARHSRWGLCAHARFHHVTLTYLHRCSHLSSFMHKKVLFILIRLLKINSYCSLLTTEANNSAIWFKNCLTF